MANRSAIEWTEVTWNPVTGCDRVSAGCDHCYALALAKRLKAMGAANYSRDGDPRTSGPGFGVSVHPRALAEPYRWRAPRVVFVNSISDLFHARDPLSFVRAVFGVIADTPQHTLGTHQEIAAATARCRSAAMAAEFVDGRVGRGFRGAAAGRTSAPGARGGEVPVVRAAARRAG